MILPLHIFLIFSIYPHLLALLDPPLPSISLFPVSALLLWVAELLAALLPNSGTRFHRTSVILIPSHILNQNLKPIFLE